MILFTRKLKYLFKFKYSIYLSILIFIIFGNYSFAQIKKSSGSLDKSSNLYADLRELKLFPDNNGIALGTQIITFDGTNWRELKSQPPQSADKISAISPNSIFISTRNKYQESELYYWDGNNWTRIYNPLANSIESMQFISKNFGVVASLGEIALLSDNKWKFLPPPNNNVIIDLEIEPDTTIWALGFRGTGLYKYKKVWQLIPHSRNIREIELIKKRLFVLGKDFLGEVIDDSLHAISKSDKLSDILSFSVSGDNNILAVGREGKILKYSGKEWINIIANTLKDLRSVKLLSQNEAWILGDDGTILKLLSGRIINYSATDWKGFENIKIHLLSKVVDDEYGVVLNDFNKDGFVDIFTCGLFEANHLYINNGEGIFNDESEKRGVSGLNEVETNELNLAACSGDLDNDGEDDLYVSVLNGKNKIYKNLGNGNFVDYSLISGGVGSTNDRTNSCILGDVNNDGSLDIFICNENSTNRLYINNGAGIFSEATNSVGLRSINGGMGSSFGDIDNDGDIDLFVANWSRKNILYKNLLSETGKLFFKNISEISNVAGKEYTKSNGVVFCDIDNDADLDLFVTNRKTSNRLYINRGNGIFDDKTQSILGFDSLQSYGAVIEDFNNDGYKDIYLSNVGENTLYVTHNSLEFENSMAKYMANISGYSTGSAYGDFDNDGDLDIYVANYVGEGSTILSNKLNTKNYIKLKVIGYKNNRNAIGTKIYVYKNKDKLKSDLIYFTEISAGSGYASMNELLKTIPINNNNLVTVKVLYPNGITKFLNNLEAGSFTTVSDIDGWNKYILLLQQRYFRLILDPHKLFELFKWVFIFALIGYSAYLNLTRYKWKILEVIIFTLTFIFLYLIQHRLLEYKTTMYSTVLPITSIITLLLLISLYNERGRIKKKALKEQLQIREKLSRDLHDDLASTISSIGIYLNLLKNNILVSNPKTNELFGKSENLIENALSSITDLIWAIKPKSETPDNLLVRINENFFSLFNEKGINFISGLDLSDKIVLAPQVKQNIYLIIKEALNNILKYANAKSVKLNISQQDSQMIITIIDDGLGFDLNSSKTKGHGLSNMKKRAAEISSNLIINATPDKGTELKLFYKIT